DLEERGTGGGRLGVGGGRFGGCGALVRPGGTAPLRLAHSVSGSLAHRTPPPRKAVLTAPLARTSDGAPSAMTWPSARHTSRVTTAVSTLSTCSTQMIAVPAEFTARIVSNSASVSGSLSPPAISS